MSNNFHLKSTYTYHIRHSYMDEVKTVTASRVYIGFKNQFWILQNQLNFNYNCNLLDSTLHFSVICSKITYFHKRITLYAPKDTVEIPNKYYVYLLVILGFCSLFAFFTFSAVHFSAS